MFYTIYKTTNKINGKIYIGAHKTHDLDDGYLGSGKHLGYAIEKYGVENFEKEILAVFDNKKDMFEMESELVNEDFVKDSKTYNLKVGGFGGFDWINKHPEKQGGGRQVLAQKIKSDPDFAKRITKNATAAYVVRVKNDKIFKENLHARFGDGFKGKKHTEEWKKKHSKFMSENQKGSGNSQYGTMWIHNLELKESKRIKKTDPIPEGWIKGRKIKFKESSCYQKIVQSASFANG